MKKAGSFLRFSAVAALTLGLALSASAQLAPDQKKDIGSPGTPGTATEAGGIWTVQGSGEIPNQGTEDSFYFVYRVVQGDGSIIARLREQVRPDGTTPKTGIMIRADDSAGSAHQSMIMTTSTLSWHYRLAQDVESYRQSGVGGYTFPTFMRMQRVGNQVSGFVTQDGKLWTEVTKAELRRPGNDPAGQLELGETALFGLAVCARSDDLAGGVFDNVSVLPGIVSITGVQSAATDKAAIAVWNPVKNAVGYHIYRGPAGSTSLDKLARLTTDARPEASFLDMDTAAGAPNAMTYAVGAVFMVDGKAVEGPIVRVR